jgi:hypothetical protein
VSKGVSWSTGDDAHGNGIFSSLLTPNTSRLARKRWRRRGKGVKMMKTCCVLRAIHSFKHLREHSATGHASPRLRECKRWGYG